MEELCNFQGSLGVFGRGLPILQNLGEGAAKLIGERYR